MTVRGWLLVGAAVNSAQSMPPERNRGWMVAGSLPNAGAFEPGDWITLQSAIGFADVYVVVDVPL